MTLPYASYLGLVIMAGLFVTALKQRGKQVWRLCIQRGFGWLTLGLLLSSSFALDRGESFLQLTNFLPFFLFFGVLATVPPVVARPFARLEGLARILLLTSVPMCAIAVIEYIIKFEAIAPTVQGLPLPDWLLNWIYEEPSFGHRAHSVFTHPNALSAYLVILLGLGLGLVLQNLNEPKDTRPQAAQISALVLCLAAIFCTGSRNGVLIALVLIAIALYAARRHRWVMIGGLVAAGAIAAALVSFGIGGRSLSLALLTSDPRLQVWQLAIEMIQQRPLLGWGFAGLRLLYVPGSIPDYDIIFHAHNIWLFLAAEAGVPVMIGFCWVVGSIFYGGIKAWLKGALPAGDRAILLGYLLAFSSCLLFALFDVTLFDSRPNLLSWSLLAAIFLLSHRAAVPDKPEMESDRQ